MPYRIAVPYCTQRNRGDARRRHVDPARPLRTSPARSFRVFRRVFVLRRLPFAGDRVVELTAFVIGTDKARAHDEARKEAGRAV